MKKMDRVPNAETLDFAYRGLYKAGAAAALIAAVIFRRNLDAEWLLLRMAGIVKAGPSEAPGAAAGWFTLLQDNRLVGLTLLNLFDLVNYALVGLIFLALCVALRRTNPSWMVIAAALTLTGISVYFASNQAFTMLSLSNRYAAATSDVERAVLLAAGQALLAIHGNASFGGPGIYLSFLLVSVAGLIISTAMLRSHFFGKGTAYLGILANGFGLGYYIVLAFAPALVFIPLSISAIFLLIWYLRTGAWFWAMGSCRTVRDLRAVPSRNRGISHKDQVSQTL